jgi:hypothetical protein
LVGIRYGATGTVNESRLYFRPRVDKPRTIALSQLSDVQGLHPISSLVQYRFCFPLAPTFFYGAGILSAAKLSAQSFRSSFAIEEPSEDADNCYNGHSNDNRDLCRACTCQVHDLPPIAVNSNTGISATSAEIKVFAGADFIVYDRTFFVPSYMPFAITRQTKKQIIRETKSATYPKINTTKAAITGSTALNGAKAIGDSLARLPFQKNSVRTSDYREARRKSVPL